MNAETSSWGRALVAVGAADAKKGVASAEEIQARRQPTRRASTRDSAARPKADDAPQDGPRMISDAQSRKLHTLLGKAGHVEREQKLAFCRSLIGREDLESSKGLTFREAAQVLSALEQALNEPHEESPA